MDVKAWSSPLVKEHAIRRLGNKLLRVVLGHRGKISTIMTDRRMKHARGKLKTRTEFYSEHFKGTDILENTYIFLFAVESSRL